MNPDPGVTNDRHRLNDTGKRNKGSLVAPEDNVVEHLPQEGVDNEGSLDALEDYVVVHLPQEGVDNEGVDNEGVDNEGVDNEESRSRLSRCLGIPQQFLNCMGVTNINLVYFIMVLTWGVVLALSVAIEKPSGINDNYIHYFFVIFMAIGILWMWGTCLFGRPQCGCCIFQEEMGNQIPCYMFFGLTIFCIGSCFVTGIDFLSFFYTLTCDDKTLDKNTATSEGVYDLVKIVFMITQLFFFCRFSGNTFYSRWCTSFFILHIIAVNLTTWVYFIVDEYVEHLSPDYLNCAALNKINKFVQEADMFLYPFNIEYSVMSSVLLLLMWFELKKKDTPRQHNTRTESESPRQPTTRTESESPRQPTTGTEFESPRRPTTGGESESPRQPTTGGESESPRQPTTGTESEPPRRPTTGKNPNHQDNQAQEEIPNHQGHQPRLNFWKQMQKTIIGSALGMVIFIIVVVLITSTTTLKHTHIPSVKGYYVGRDISFLLMAFACISGLLFMPQPQPASQSKLHTKVDSILIMIGVSGCYVMTFFQLISATSEKERCTPMSAIINSSSSNLVDSSNNSLQYCKYLEFFIADNVVCLFQFSFQAVFIVRALRCGREEVSQANNLSLSVVRNASAALSLANFGIWIMDTFELKDIKTLNAIETSAYGSTWHILVHIVYPLCIFFRLHSAFCFIEIVINRFGVTAHENNGQTNSSVQAQQTASSV